MLSDKKIKRKKDKKKSLSMETSPPPNVLKMLSDKKIKHKKDKKKFLSMETSPPPNVFEKLPEKKMKPKKEKKKSKEISQSPPVEKALESPKLSNLKQLFEARNASLKGKKEQLPEAEDALPKKVKKRKAEEVSQEKADFPREGPVAQPDRAVQRKRKKEAKLNSKRDDERLGQTLFVGNLPLNITRKSLEKIFGKFGLIQSVRLRGAIPVKTKISKRVADITRNFHDGLHSRKGFVVFKDAEGAEAALALNGTLIDDHHIIVDKASGAGQKKTYDNKRTIFIGNLPFDVDDEVVWNAFASCGEVEAVRVVRDKATGAGKGFGYVLFKAEESRTAALEQEKVEIDGRNVRVKAVEGKQQNKGNYNKKKSGYGLALKAKSRIENPQSRKSAKKLLKREKAKHQKKKVAQNFKQFF